MKDDNRSLRGERTGADAPRVPKARRWVQNLPAWILRTPQWSNYSPGQRHALYVMAWRCDRAKRNGGNLLPCYCGEDLIAEIGCSHSGFWKWYAEFERDGFIVTMARGAGRAGANTVGIPKARGALDNERVERRAEANGRGGAKASRWDKARGCPRTAVLATVHPVDGPVHSVDADRPPSGGTSVHPVDATIPSDQHHEPNQQPGGPAAAVAVVGRAEEHPGAGDGTDPPHSDPIDAVRQLFCELWSAEHGGQYPWEARDAAEVPKLLTACKGDRSRCRRVVRAYLRCHPAGRDEFFAGHPFRRLTHPNALPRFVADANAYLASRFRSPGEPPPRRRTLREVEAMEAEYMAGRGPLITDPGPGIRLAA